MVHYHRYERTFTTNVPYEVWQYAEKTVIYEWTKMIEEKYISYSLTKPDSDDYVGDSLEKKTFSCSNENAPKYKESCLLEYEPPEIQRNGPGVK